MSSPELRDRNEHVLRVTSIKVPPDSVAEGEIGRNFRIDGVKTPLCTARTDDKSFYPYLNYRGRLGHRLPTEETPAHAYIEAQGARGTEGELNMQEEMSRDEFDAILNFHPGLESEPASVIGPTLDASKDFINSRVNAELDRQQAAHEAVVEE